MPFICNQCNEYVSSRVDGVCQKCRIGDENPTLWAVKQIKNTLLDDDYWAVSHRNGKHRRAYESLLFDIETGEYVREATNKNLRKTVAMSIDAECDNDASFSNLKANFHRWKNGGSSSFGHCGPYEIPDIESFEGEVLPRFNEALIDLINYAKSGKEYCVDCEDVIEPEDYGGHRFAGGHCKRHWEAFKRKHSRKCLKCKSPEWCCYC